MNNSLSYTNNFATEEVKRAKPQPQEEMSDYDFEIPFIHKKELGPFELSTKVDILL